LARCTFEIIREAVTNSVKHGSADEVLIRLGVNRELKLEVLNNGKPAPKLTGYAGEELFDQLCLSHQIENREGKVVLEALLALSPEDQQQYQI
jgi:glucose-6-phosphate-specific signal transduction histidine kinase